VIIGGIGSLEGPIIGTLIFFALRYFLADYGALYLITLGTIAIVVMLKAPRGLWGLIGDGLNIHLFPIQRRVRLGVSGSGTLTRPVAGEDAALGPGEDRFRATTEK
jgi:branched-chain amino acid transport system permease protein